jgi:hypothetical protein
MERRADQIQVRVRDNAITIGDGAGAILRVALPRGGDQNAAWAWQALTDLATAARDAANRLDPGQATETVGHGR